jgi:CRISPR system Cascade subunit CasC
MKNFINFHILISHSPSCLNRDDMNMQKSAVFGGVRRVRVSSQSLKRALRTSPYFRENVSQHSRRTRELGLLLKELSKKLEQSFPKGLIEKAISFLADTRNIEVEDNHADAVAPWCAEEVAWLCSQLESNEILMKFCDDYLAISGDGTNEKKRKRTIEKATYKEIEKNEQMAGLFLAFEKNIDLALWGRMAASGLMKSVDGALAVAHALTTHNVDSDIDWFTAVDDLQELGSGHLDTQEFSSGVFYRYASLNIGQLQENLGGASREKVLEIAAHVLHMLSTVVPSAKQQSFAAHNLADLALVSFSDLPISLANAFEQPVQQNNGSGYRGPSMAALHNYWQKVHRGYGLAERCGQFSLSNSAAPEDIVVKQSLEDLKAWVCNNGEG